MNNLIIKRLRYQIENNSPVNIQRETKKTSEEFIALGDTCYKDHDLGCSFDNYFMSVLKSPDNITVFERMGNNDRSDCLCGKCPKCEAKGAATMAMEHLLCFFAARPLSTLINRP